MKHDYTLKIGEEGILSGTIKHFIPYYQIYIEDCRKQSNTSGCKGKFAVYQLHEGQDLRTQALPTFEEAYRCAEKMKNDINSMLFCIDEVSQKMYQTAIVERENHSAAQKAGLFGTINNKYGIEHYIVYVDKTTDGEYIVYGLDTRNSILLTVSTYEDIVDAKEAAKSITRQYISRYLTEKSYDSLVLYRKFGVILYAHPKNDAYVSMDSHGNYVLYEYNGYRQLHWGYVNYHGLFNDLKSAIKSIHSVYGDKLE